MKILIVKTSALGDIIHTFPALAYLRERFPDAQIDWVAEKGGAALLDAHPQVDRVLVIESKKWRKNLFQKDFRNFVRCLREVKYDIIVDVQGNVKSALILAFARGKKRAGFGWKMVPEWPNAFLTSQKINPPTGKNVREDYLAVVQGIFDDETPFEAPPLELEGEVPDVAGKTLVFPGSAWPNKQLSPDQLRKFLEELDRGPYLFGWGNKEEKKIANALAAQFTGSEVLERLPLPALQRAMAKCALVVAMDSLPLHLCGTTKTPSIGFFGPSSAKKYAPKGAHVYQGTCPYGITFEKRCPKLRTCQTGACLKLLHPKDK